MAINGSRFRTHRPLLFIIFMTVISSSVIGQTIFELNPGSDLDDLPFNQSQVQILNKTTDISCYLGGPVGSDPLQFGNQTCLYNKPVQLLQPPLNQTVTEFTTLFTVQATYDNGNGNFQAETGLAFVITSTAPTNSGPNSTTLSIVFFFDISLNQSAKLHVAGFTESITVPVFNYTSDVAFQGLCNQSGGPCEIVFTVLIMGDTDGGMGNTNYSNRYLTLQVGAGETVVDAEGSGLINQYNIDLLTVLRNSNGGDGEMYVGFESWDVTSFRIPGALSGNFSYQIVEWTFNSDGLPPGYYGALGLGSTPPVASPVAN